MDQELRALLLGNAGITNLVSTRINFGTHPQGKPLPAIVLNVASAIEQIHMNGKGPHQVRFQIDCYATTYAAAKQAGDAVNDLLNAYVGGGFLFIRQVARRRTREGGANESTRDYRDSQDFITHWRQVS